MHSDVRESICVQLMDGQLSLYEQDVLTFARLLPDILIPGPLGYMNRTIAITLTGNFYVSCEYYSFIVVTIATAVTKHWLVYHQLWPIRIKNDNYSNRIT